MQAALWLLLQAALQKPTDTDCCCLREHPPIGSGSENCGDRIRDGPAWKRGATSQHLVEHAAEGPDVCPLVDRLAAGLLGTHVRCGADDQSLACVIDRDRR